MMTAWAVSIDYVTGIGNCNISPDTLCYGEKLIFLQLCLWFVACLFDQPLLSAMTTATASASSAALLASSEVGELNVVTTSLEL